MSICDECYYFDNDSKTCNVSGKPLAMSDMAINGATFCECRNVERFLRDKLTQLEAERNAAIADFSTLKLASIRELERIINMAESILTDSPIPHDICIVRGSIIARVQNAIRTIEEIEVLPNDPYDP